MAACTVCGQTDSHRPGCTARLDAAIKALEAEGPLAPLVAELVQAVRDLAAELDISD